MGLDLEWLIEEYEKSNCRSRRVNSSHYPDEDEINNVLKAIGAPEIAVNTSAPGENDGSELFLVNYYMILKLAKRISELEKKLEEK